MFKSIKWKTVSVFALLILLVVMASGAFLMYSVSDYYHDGFFSQMADNLDHNFIVGLENGYSENPEYIKNAMQSRIKSLSINANRNYYIISEETGEVLYGSNDAHSAEYLSSANFLTALSGEIGNSFDMREPYMDYAVPVETVDGTQVIYIKDNKHDLMRIVRRILDITVQVLIVSVFLAILVGYFLSRSVAKPISTLTMRAKHMSEGEFDVFDEPLNSSKEIGLLSETFDEMSKKFQDTLSDISTEKNKIEAILQNMTDGVMSFGTDGKIIHMNSTAKKMLGIKHLERYRFDKLFSLLGANILIGDLLYFEDNRRCEREVMKDNLALKVNFAVFDDERNKTGGVLAVFHDITRQQKLENSRREFVANVSHELRTPLTTVKSYAETLLDVVKDNKMAETFTNTILNETDRMTRLVKDLLVLSSLENTASLNKSKFPLKTVLSDVVSTMSLVAREKGHRLQFEETADIPDFFGDRDKLEQVFYNIISNSIKYTPNGGKIVVRAGRVYNDIKIEVEDTGIGIPEKDISRIFERFYRVDKARSRELGGTGLGLAISKSIIDSHGGTIEIKSQWGEGTTVSITLPIMSA